jgi:transketolase
MAITERWLANYMNRPGFPIIDYNVYALCGDGDMMEGISGEAASLAGHLRLSNLCWIYDSNRITIEGSTALAFSEDVGARFLAYGWNVLRVRDANDIAGIKLALAEFDREQSRPTFILVESHIGYGAPKKQDTKEAHGEPLGEEEIRGAKLRAEWKEMFERYRAEHPKHSALFEAMERRELPPGWEEGLLEFPADPKGVASRDASGKVLNALAARIPYLMGGAADLAPSTKTNMKDLGSFEADDYAGRNFHFGIREHAMGAICNGMALSKVRAFGSGFLIFSDYMRAPIRLSSLMELPVVWVFTHDSIGVGEDGPTHQPIEQLASLRGIPGVHVVRPCDANEVSEAWRLALKATHQPTCLILSRQALPTIDRSKYASAAGLARGAYVLADPQEGRPEVILMATGSEVSLCLAVHEELAKEGIRSRVVSMPCWDMFERQDEAYRREVLPDDILARVSVEQAATLGWDRYVGLHGSIIGMHTFGSSAPLKDLLKHFGFTPEAVTKAARDQIARHKTMKQAAE